jgi:integrase
MSPYRRQGGASYYITLRWKGWPKIRLATGTTNKSRAIAMERTLHALKSAGRRDILELLAAGRLELHDVHDSYLRDPAALEQRLARAKSQAIGPLLDAWYTWLEDPATLSPKTRRPFSPRTVQGYRWCWDQLLQLLPRGRDALLTELTTGFVADFRQRRRAGGASGPTINRNLTALSAFLSWAEQERGLALPRPRLPHEREHPGRDRWLSADEIRALQRATVAPWWPVYALLVYTGLRWSEAAGLIWAEVRLAERRIAVGRQQRRVKTEASVRDVPIPAPLAELLAQHRLRVAGGPADLVFPAPLDSYQRAQRAFQAACNRAGLHGVRLHDLRHTFWVHCARAGVPLARIQKLMGHATLAMTLRYLQHAPESFFDEDGARVAESLSGARDAEAQAAAELLRGGMRPA